MLDSSYQDVKRLFVLAYDNANRITDDSQRRYFLPGIKTENYNIETDGISFYDQPINDLIKQYDEIAVDSSKQKALDADSRVIQQIIFTGKSSADTIIYYILEKSKEAILEFSKGTTKFCN